VDSIHSLLKTELQNNELQVMRLDSLNRLIDHRFGAIVGNIKRFQASNFQMTDTMIVEGFKGKIMMDSIRALILRMQLHEEAVLKDREGQVHGQYSALNTVVITSLILALVLAIYGFVTYTRENIARRKADQTIFEYQEELKDRIQQLDKANRELVQMRSIEKLAATGRIARTIAHEVRNPLTNINLSVDQLKTEVETTDETVASLFEMITRNSNRINALITDLLNSTKFTELVYKKESVNKLLDDTLELAKDRMHLKNIRVIKEYSDDICDVSVDVERIRIAFLNIIVNALEAMEPEKGILKLKTASIDDKCTIYISDNGSGIDKESLSKLFEPYFTSKPKGTGLGLTNAQNIILNHNGNIYAESEVGKGTTFVISLDFA
jgi:signal transduction histidine kinase